MKTSVIEVHDMLSVLTVDEVEKRIREVPGVESATANYAAGSATVRYDETRLDVADIKAIVHQRGHQPAGESLPKHVSEHEPARERAVVPTPEAAPASASAPVAAVPKAAPIAPAAVPAPAAPAVDGHKGHAAPASASTPVAAAPKAPRALPPRRADSSAVDGQRGQSGTGRRPRPPPRPRRPLPQPTATRATRRRARSPPCRRIWRMRWAMAARTCRPWSATCATVSGSA